MELKIFRDTLPQAGANCTLKTELPLETEILISDYLPQIFKLVKCFVKPVVLQKRLQSGRFVLDGYLRCTVFYQGEEGAGLCQTEQKLPFSRQIDLPEFPFTSWTAVVEAQTEYINSRAVDPRRIELRGAVSLLITVRAQCKTEVITALADGGIEQQLSTLHGTRSTLVVDKMITLEGTMEFAQKPGAVLDITGRTDLRELKLLSGKAVVKGELKVQCAWRTSDKGVLQEQSATLFLNQVLDLEGLTEDSQLLCVPEPIGFTLTQGEQENVQQLTANVMLHLRGWRPYQLQYVSDAFSTCQETKISSCEIVTESVVEMVNETVEGKGIGPLPDAGAQLKACFVSYGPIQLVCKGGDYLLACRATATAFAENSLAELESYEKTIELALPVPRSEEAVEQLYPECWIQTEDIRCSCSGGTLEVTVTAWIEGAVLARKTQQGVSEIELGEALVNADPEIALRIYYARKDEAIFDIARRFCVSPSQILQANDLDAESKELTVPQHLLIPAK